MRVYTAESEKEIDRIIINIFLILTQMIVDRATLQNLKVSLEITLSVPF